MIPSFTSTLIFGKSLEASITFVMRSASSELVSIGAASTIKSFITDFTLFESAFFAASASAAFSCSVATVPDRVTTPSVTPTTTLGLLTITDSIFAFKSASETLLLQAKNVQASNVASNTVDQERFTYSTILFYF